MITKDNGILDIITADMEEIHKQVLLDPNLKQNMQEMANWVKNEYSKLEKL